MIAAILFSLSSCGEDEAKKAAEEQIKKEYPLLGLDIPYSLHTQTFFADGFCKEDKNERTFKFSNEVFFIKEWRNLKSGEIDVNFGAAGGVLNVPTSRASVRFKGPKERYDRATPPTICLLDFNKDKNLIISDLVKGESVCRRKIIGYANEQFLTFYKDEAAICEFRVTSRLNCIPDEFFNKLKKFQQQQLLEKLKHEKCSSPNLLEYKKQTRSRWQKHKEKLLKTAAD